MGRIELFPEFYSPPEGFNRGFRVFLPEAYDERPDERFGVLYMQDGQNVFAHPSSARFDTWTANWTMDRLVAEDRIDPWIIVAIDHGADRFSEYSYWDEPKLGSRGRGYQYTRYVTDHVKPFIDERYRTLADAPHTATMGASLGGLMALTMHLQHPEIFGRVGAVSPTVMWADGALFREWTAHTRQWSRIWLDAGATEYVEVGPVPLDYAGSVAAFYRHLRGLGYANWELALHLEPGAEHNEIGWRDRLPEIFAWVLARL